MFYAFTILFIIIVFTRLNVSDSYEVNEAVRVAIDENALSFRS